MIAWLVRRGEGARGTRGFLVLCALWSLFVGAILGLGLFLSAREARDISLHIARDRFELNRMARMAGSGPAPGPGAPGPAAGPGDPGGEPGPNPRAHGAQIFSEGNLDTSEFKGHLISLRPERKTALLDGWERRGLQSLQSGAGEYWEVDAGRGNPYLRYLKPLVAAPACMACHAGQGFRDGATIGAISLSVPMAQGGGAFGSPHNLATVLGTVLFWSLGLGALWAARNWRAHRDRERAQAQEALRASEALYRELLERQGEGLAVVDEDERFVMVNGVAEAIFGAPGTLKGRSLMEFLAEDQRALVRRQSALRGEGRSSTYELQIRRESDGSDRILLVTATPGIGPGQHAIGVIRDITERRLAEDALRRSEANLQAVLASAMAGLLAIDHGRRVLHLNRRFSEIWQIPQELLDRRSDEDLLAFVLTRLTDPAAFLAKLEALYGSDQEVSDTLILRDGRTIERHSLPMVMDQQIIGRVWSFLDVTARVRAEEERTRFQEQLNHARRMESLGHLAGGVAHDMNNVLAAILGVASSQLTLNPEGSAGHRALELIAKAAARGGKIVQGLLQFARKTPAEDRQIDMNELLREQAGLMQGENPGPVQIETRLAPDLLPIRGDARALTLALMNLCTNALEALGGAGRLVLGSSNLGPDGIEVQVEDEGAGMASEVRDRAFDPFFTTKEQGTGLGLSLVYTTVKAHRGEIEIRSQPGRGTQVVMRFPAAKAGFGVS